MSAAQSSQGTQVLEFRLGGDRYCVDLTSVAEIVDMRPVTRLPNAPRDVRGIVDLRGRTTTIVDPRHRLNIDTPGDERRVIVFDVAHADEGPVGWVVDSVEEVRQVHTDAVDERPVEHEPRAYGVVRHDDGLVVWLHPERSDGTSSPLT